MISPDFTRFVLDLLEADGMAFAVMDFALFERGNRTWTQLKERSLIPREQMAGSIMMSASELKFIEREPGMESFRLPPRVQARFEIWPGDSYWLCLELSVEQLLTRYHEGQSWTLLPETDKVDTTTF